MKYLEAKKTLLESMGNPAWCEALEMWLRSRQTENTRRAYVISLVALFQNCDKEPREITRTDMLRWSLAMKESGLSPATIAQRIVAVSSFYRFTMEDYFIHDEQGRETPLHTYNPASGRSLRPTVEMYGKSTWLAPEEATALLKAIPRYTAHGLRDYALFLGYILMARRNSEWRQARWDDFERHGNKVSLRWSGKGKRDQLIEVPLPVWNAVCEYLQKTGSLKAMQPEWYIFTAISRQGQTLPNGERIQVNVPISSHEVGRLLQRYLRLAGIEPRHIKPHSLRHTGAMLQRAAGASDQEIMQFLGHSNLVVTQVYLHLLEGNSDAHWMRVSELLGIAID